MKTSHILLLIVSLLLLGFQTSSAQEVRYGKLETVLVALSGDTDSTFVTEFIDNWYARGPNALDVDKDGNVYILDWLGEKVVKFDKDGKWMSSFNVPGAPGFPGTRPLGGIGNRPEFWRPGSVISVDNWGNVYVTTGNILKFSPEGRLLLRLHHAVMPHVSVDAHGRFYSFAGMLSGIVDIYSAEGERKATLHHDFEYGDRVVTQKEVGDDIYLRVGRHLVKTTLEDFLGSGNLDTVAILPNPLRVLEYRQLEPGEEGSDPSPSHLIGVDRNNCFYFHDPSYWYGSRIVRNCESHLLQRYCLENGELHLAGYSRVNFLKGKDGECTHKGLWDFVKTSQFVVAGDGTIYFLHGTVDTIRVSKLTID